MCMPRDDAKGDTIAIDPRDMTNKYNTQLTPEQEVSYGKWAQDSGHARDTYDYDMRGAWLEGAGQSDNGHFTDDFKKPNHPTFSDQSRYSGKDGNVGGKWEQDKDGSFTFTPGPSSAKHWSAKDLAEYFKKVEPGNRLILPAASEKQSDLSIPVKGN